MSRLDDLYGMRARLAEQIHFEEGLAAMPVRSDETIRRAAELYGVTSDAILSTTRDARVVKARQAAMWMLRERGLSLPRVGAILNRDHTTVLYAVRKIDADPAKRALLWPLLGRGEAA